MNHSGKFIDMYNLFALLGRKAPFTHYMTCNILRTWKFMFVQKKSHGWWKFKL